MLFTFDIRFTNGISYQCNSSNCEYQSDVDGCIKISEY